MKILKKLLLLLVVVFTVFLNGCVMNKGATTPKNAVDNLISAYNKDKVAVLAEAIYPKGTTQYEKFIANTDAKTYFADFEKIKLVDYNVSEGTHFAEVSLKLNIKDADGQTNDYDIKLYLQKINKIWYFTSTPNLKTGNEKPVNYTINDCVEITFNTLNGTTVLNQIVEKNKKAIIPESPSKNGVVFVTWCTDEACTKVFDFNTVITEDTTLYAKWGITYTLTYDTKGGVQDENPVTTYTEIDEVDLPIPTKAGFMFEGWCELADLSDEPIYELTKGTTGNKLLYAKWATGYTIEYETNGGVNPDDLEVGYYKEEIVLPIPTRKSYDFIGWYLNKDFSGDIITKIEASDSGDKVFYARWELIYQINYELNGGILEEGYDTTYNKLDEIILPIPQKHGYKFLGWFEKEDFSDNKVDKITKGTESDLKFYAKWELQTYKIEYVLNGGTLVEIAKKEFTIESSFELLNPEKRGYNFLGWYENEDFFGDKIEKIEFNSVNDRKLYAKFEAIDYLVSYELNGGENPNDAIKTYNVSKDFILPVPTRTGYRFLGWFDNDKFTGEVVTIIKENTIIDDVKYYAKWIVEYTITYVLDGGTISSKAEKEYITTENINLRTPEKEGYKFLGWYNNKDFTGETVEEIAIGSVGNKTFYAKWIQIFTITYNLGGGTNPADAPTSYVFGSEVVLPIPTKNGYRFVNWYTTSDFQSSTIVKGITSTDTGDKVLYAKYTDLYEIKYNLDGGKLPEDAVKGYVITDEVILPIPTKENYDFDGWYMKADLSGDKVTEIKFGTTGAKEYFAKWKRYYKIIYSTPADTLFGSDKVEKQYGDKPLNLSIPTRNGYHFGGWYEKDDFSGEAVTVLKSGTLVDVTYYAKWYQVYPLSFTLNGGSFKESVPNTYISGQEFILPIPEKNGSVFEGWYTSYDFTGSKVTKIEVGATGMKKFYAHWIKGASITYELDGGTNHRDAVTQYSGKEAVTLLKPTKENYEFVGWYEKNDPNKTIVTEIASTESPTDKTFCAIWAITYTITYNVNGGTLDSDAITKYSGLNVITLPTPTKNDATFDGWYESPNFSGSKVIEIAKTSTPVAKTYYARWIYTITYNLNEGTNDPNAVVNYDGTIKVTLPIPTKPNFEFGGWYENVGLTGTAVTEIPATTTPSPKTYYAKWNAVTNYTITYNLNGGEALDNPKTTYVKGDTFDLPVPTKANFEFGGWYESSDFSTVLIEKINGTDERSLVLYAKWNIKITVENSKNYIYLGEYPQTVVTDKTITEELNKLTTKNSLGYYEYKGVQYAKVKASITGDVKFNNGTVIENEKDYYFKVEPIKWQVLINESGTITILSEKILDAQKYNTEAPLNNKYFTSKLSKWLVGTDFYEKAINDYLQEFVLLKDVSNRADTTDSNINSFEETSLKLKIFLLSYKDTLNTNYNFVAETGASDTRKAIATDYARALGLVVTNNFSSWYLRSPLSTDATKVSIVKADGALDSALVDTLQGIRPAMKVELPE